MPCAAPRCSGVQVPHPRRDPPFRAPRGLLRPQRRPEPSREGKEQNSARSEREEDRGLGHGGSRTPSTQELLGPGYQQPGHHEKEKGSLGAGGSNPPTYLLPRGQTHTEKHLHTSSHTGTIV